jgi:hypothetical protein
MICAFNNGLCFVELLISAVLLGFGFGVGQTLWGLITKRA